MNSINLSKSHRFQAPNTTQKKSCINLFTQKEECNLVTQKVIQVNPIPSNSSNLVNRSIVGFTNLNKKKLSLNKSCIRLNNENNSEINNVETQIPKENIKEDERNILKDVSQDINNSNKVSFVEQNLDNSTYIKSFELNMLNKNQLAKKHKYNFSDGLVLSKIRYDMTAETDSASTKSVSDKNDTYLLDELTNLEEKLELIKTVLII